MKQATFSRCPLANSALRIKVYVEKQMNWCHRSATQSGMPNKYSRTRTASVWSKWKSCRALHAHVSLSCNDISGWQSGTQSADLDDSRLAQSTCQQLRQKWPWPRGTAV